jgi:hypothetical protein
MPELVAVHGDPERCQHPRRETWANGYWGCEACGGSGKVRDWGLLFSPPMLRALDLDLKTHTRRLDLRLLNVRRGDRVYAKEAWAPVPDVPNAFLHRAAWEAQWPGGHPQVSTPRWKSPLFMPKQAARLWREVTRDAYLERVQSISEEAALAEGSCIRHDFKEPHAGYAERLDIAGARGCFANAWDEINAKKGGWAANHEAVVLHVRRLP